ncbi:MAG TPA: HAMP domain-containing sensor histidine kinase [Gaiellaceae bacterium]|nr:HAMP domain-containing sensor histidine kinase [Gaiellaceae bacterium]
MSVRLKLTLSYAGFLMLAGTVLLAAGYFSLSRGVHPGVIFIVQSHADLLRYFAPIAAIVMTFLLVFGLVGGWLLAGRMLAPLTRITDATRMAADGSLSHRIELDGRKDEFRELADAFDTMLARLEAHIAEQQRFAANASHELRTPLAITQTLLDVARNDPNRDNGELVDRLHAVNTRAIDLTEALLLLSRADQRSFTREHVDLSLIAEEATETLLPLAEKRGLTIETSGDTTPTIGSHALLLQLSTNLVHNAIAHNLPEQGTVWVTTSAQPKSVEPGVSSATNARNQLFKVVGGAMPPKLDSVGLERHLDQRLAAPCGRRREPEGSSALGCTNSATAIAIYSEIVFVHPMGLKENHHCADARSRGVLIRSARNLRTRPSRLKG